MTEIFRNRGTQPLTGPKSGPPPSDGLNATPAPNQLNFPLSDPTLEPTYNAVRQDKVRVAPQGTSLQNLSWLSANSFAPPPYATVDAHLNLQDLDGLDQRSSKDLKGTLDLDLKIGKNLLEHSLAEANKEVSALKFSLHYQASSGTYRIDTDLPTWVGDMGLGSIYLKPDGDKLKVEIGGVTGGLAKVANFISFGTARGAVENLVKNLSKDMGFKVSSSSMTAYELEPDLANSPLFKELPLAGGETLKLESVTPHQGSLVRLGTDNAGNLTVKMQDVNVVASSQSKGPQAKADAEGADRLDVRAQVRVDNTFSATVQSDLNLDLNVRPEERAGLQQRLKGLTGQDLPVSGHFSLKDLEVDAQVDAQGHISELNSQGGQLQAQDLNLSMAGTEMKLQDVSGQLEAHQANGVSRLSAEQVNLKGSVHSPQGSLNMEHLHFSGTLVHDQKSADQLSFELSGQDPLEFSGSLSQGGQTLKIRDLSLNQAQLKTDLSSGRIQLAGQGKQTPEARIKSLGLPDAALYDVRLKGDLDANLQSGTVNLNAKSFGMAVHSQDLKLQWLQGSGQLELNSHGDLSLKNAHFNTLGQAGDVGIKKLSGQGDLRLSASGVLDLQSVRNLKLETDLGLSVSGNFKGKISPQQYLLETQDKAASISYTNPDFDLDLKNIQVQGRMQMDPRTQKVVFSNLPGSALQLNSGQISGLHLKDVRLEGQVALDGQKLSFAPHAGQPLKASGQLDEVRIDKLQSTGPVVYDLQHQEISWQGKTQASLPLQNMTNLSTEGPMSVKIEPNGQVRIRSENGILNGKLGDLQLEDIHSNGEVLFDPQTQVLRFAGLEGKEGLEVSGKLNGHPIQLSSSGEIQIQQGHDKIQITGQNIHLNGLLDGFTLESPKGVKGTVSIKPDFSGFSLDDLNFGFAVDDIQVDSHGRVRSTSEGLEIDLDGALGSDKGHLQSLLGKLAGQEDMNAQARSSLEQVQKSLDQAFADFDDANLNFEDLHLKLDPQMNLQSFTVRNNSELHNAHMDVDLNGHHTRLPMGTVRWTADVTGKPNHVDVSSGQIQFSLNDELRQTLAKEVKKELEDSGLKDVSLSITPAGKIQIDNVTYQHKKLKLSAELDISTHVENNQLVVSLDHLKMKNLLFDIVGKIINAPEKVSDQVEDMLQKQHTKHQRRDRHGDVNPEHGRIFALDLQDLTKQIDPGIKLQNASMDAQGQIQINYSYSSDL